MWPSSTFPLWAAQTARLTGRVVDENVVPVASAQVILVQEGRAAAETFTDDSGHFEFDALMPGAATVNVRKPEYFELTGREVALTAGENDLTLALTHETELKETVEVRSRRRRSIRRKPHIKTVSSSATFWTRPCQIPMT